MILAISALQKTIKPVSARQEKNAFPKKIVTKLSNASFMPVKFVSAGKKLLADWNLPKFYPIKEVYKTDYLHLAKS